MSFRRLAAAVAVAIVVSLLDSPAAALRQVPALPAVPTFDDRITWHSTPTYTYEARPGQHFAHWYRVDSSFELRTLEPITNESQVLISFRGTSGEFISAGLAAPPFGRDGFYRYGTSFPADWFPPPGTYTVNSVCRHWTDGRKRCRAAYPAEAASLVIPEYG